MKYLILHLIVIFLFISSIKTQSTYSKIYDSDYGDDFGNIDIYANQNNIYIYGAQRIPIDLNVVANATNISKFNFQGNLLQTFLIDSLFPNNTGNKYNVINDKIYITGNSHNQLHQGRDTYVMEFDTNFNFISSFSIPTDSNEYHNSNGMLIEGTYGYIYGNVFLPGQTRFGRIVKIDLANKEIIWEKRYGIGNSDNNCNALIGTGLNSLAFVNSWDDGAGSNSNYGRAITFVDTNGNIIDTIEGGSGSSYFETLFYDDEGYVYTGFDESPTDDYWTHSGYVNKYNVETKELVWTFQLPIDVILHPRNYFINDIIEASNGDIVVGGTVWDDTDEYPNYNGFMTRITSDGELVWNRVYKVFNPLPSPDQVRPLQQGYLYNITNNPQGGFLGVGAVSYHGLQLTTLPEDSVFQKNWLLSVDENGNIEGEEHDEMIYLDEVNANSPQYQIGTQWVYQAMGNQQFAEIFPVVVTIIDTQMVNDTLAFVLEEETNFMQGITYLYVNDAKVYFYDEVLDQFILNYDYDDPAQYNTPYSFVTGGSATEIADVNLDSVTTIMVPSGEVIEVQHLGIENSGTVTETLNTRVYKGIGGNDYLRLKLGFGLADDSQIQLLRCFTPNINTDSTINFVGLPCDSSWILSSTEEIGLKELSLYPNPTTGQIFLNGLDVGVSVDYWLYDLFGRQIEAGKMNHAEFKLDAPAGTYLLRIEDAHSKVYINRVVLIEDGR